MKNKIIIGILSGCVLLSATGCSSYENNMPQSGNNEEMVALSEHSRSNSCSSDNIEQVCNKINDIDFSIKDPVLNLTPEADAVYRSNYLKALKNEVPIIDYDNNETYFKDLYKIGTDYTQLTTTYSYYYTDLDNDEAPELGIRSNGYTYILKYDMECDVIFVQYRGATMYITILGNGQLWHHDGLHAGLIRDEYIVYEDGEWKTLVKFEQGVHTPEFYSVSIDEHTNIDIGKDNWENVTLPFFTAVKSPIASQSFVEVFCEQNCIR